MQIPEAVTSDLQALDLPDRDPRLPPLYVYNTDHHPLIKTESGSIVVVLQDDSLESMADNLDAASEMEVPVTKEENHKMGE
jgi:hypothetical protein